ncbi:MAG: porin, partial [Verrucomicrobia bacterium]|nr:porin [Verrucomicrobiota bacterium]
KEIADLKRNTATPATEQQGTGQNIGGTTTKENLLGGTRRSLATPRDDKQGAAVQGDRTDSESRLSLVERKQELADEESAKKAATTPNISFNEKGLVFKSADGNHALRLGGVLQLDGRTFIDEARDDASQFLVRRARVYAAGTLWKYIDFRFMPDFGTVDAQNTRNTAIICDAWLNFNAQKEFQIQVGKFKPPLGLEMLQSDQNTVFMERGPVGQLQPNRMLGFMPNGLLFDDTLNWAFGVFADAPDNYTQTLDTGGGYNIAARLFARPFVNDADELAGLGFGVAGSYMVGDETAASTAISNGLNTFSSDAGNTFFTWNSTATKNGAAYRINPQAFYYYGPWGVQAEYILESQGISLSAGNSNVQRPIRDTSWAWQGTLSYNITGEDNSFDSLVPANNFDFFQSEDPDAVGLWQIAFRADQLQLDSDLFNQPTSSAPFASGGAAVNARGYHAYSLGLSWFLNPNIRAYLDGVYTIWDYASSGTGANAAVPSNNQFITNNEFAITGRLQLFF